MILFGVTIFAGAFLLFLVQPMLGKAILPWFGGSPSVWTACMLFFQVVLLGGYVYAHRLGTRLSPRRQALVHSALVAASLLALPILPSARWEPADSGSPVWHIIALLGASAGPTYFMLATTGPLLQSWFSRLSAASPYPLYALSNLGSLLGLLLYPVLFEPSLPLRDQAGLWMTAYVVFAVMSIVCAVRVGRGGTAAFQAPEAPPGNRNHSPAPSAARLSLWLLLPAAGSLLLLATTNQICQDVAVVPLLWILPLALYLLTFILCFQSERWYSRLWFGIAFAVALAQTCYVLYRGVFLDLRLQVAAYAATLFVACMVCHGELARLKPGARHLTLFYGMVAAGGALGGAFVTFVAPVTFKGFWEYPLGLVAALLLLLVVLYRDRESEMYGGRPIWAWTLLLIAVCCLTGYLFHHVRRSFEGSVEVSRTFFGTLRVLEENSGVAERHRFTLMHGRIEHGFQFTSESKRYWPTSYFGPESGVGLAIRFHPRRVDPALRNLRIGVIGLGTGTLATYGEAGDLIRFYELSPDVGRLSRKYFTYLQDSPAQVDVLFGDGRVTLERQRARGEAQQFDLLAVDAFSSDAIPVHLLTRECLDTYRFHVKEDGVLAFNISNRYLNLRPVIRGMAAATGDMKAVWIPGTGNPLQETDDSDWVLLTRNTRFLETPEVKLSARSWRDDEPEAILWTDDFSNLFRLLRYRR